MSTDQLEDSQSTSIAQFRLIDNFNHTHVVRRRSLENRMKSRRHSVLIAENDRSIAQGLRSHLEHAGFTAFLAYDGEQAAILAARQRFDLIIVNLKMPEMNGEEFCRHVREELQLTEVPIAVCSSSAFDTEVDGLRYTYGISHVFCEPVNLDAIVEFARETVEVHTAAI